MRLRTALIDVRACVRVPPCSCEACSSGTEATGDTETGGNTGATRCELCDAGQYDHDSGSGVGSGLSANTPCIDCPAGRIAGTAGQVRCAS